MLKILFTSLFIILITASSVAAEIIGKVIGVSDGDTITVLDELDKGRFRVRLFGIDCPEKSQDFGNVAKKHLSSLIFGKRVSIRFREIDRYGRIVGKVLLDGSDINLKMIEAGLA